VDNIVLGVDGSSGSQNALSWAVKQAKQTDAHVVAVHAVPRTGLWSLSALQVDIEGVLRELRTLLEGSWTADLRASGVPFGTELVRGDPATELLRIANRTGASLVVLGAKSHSALADLIVGGTAHKVINRSAIPVVLVPPSAEPGKHSPLLSSD
jgi:nucleotide-binding universal stress UspA family protein